MGMFSCRMTYSAQGGNNKGTVNIEIVVHPEDTIESSETLAYDIVMLFADIGGYVGLLLGK